MSVKVENHVFTCVLCGRGWTVISEAELECFFLGVCYWCLREHKLSSDAVREAIKKLLEVQ